MSSPIPQKLFDFISLSDLFNDLGRQLYIGWSGEELNMDEIPPFEEACELKKEEIDHRELLKSRVGRSDDEYIQENIKLKELTDEFFVEQLEILDDPWQYYNEIPIGRLLLRIDSMASRLSRLPNLSDREEYDKQRKIWERREETVRAIIDLLQNNKIIAYCRTSTGREKIDNGLWAALDVRLDVIQIEAYWPHLHDTKQGIHFKREDVEIFIIDLKKEISSKTGATIKIKKQVEQYLIELMSQGSQNRRPKEKIRRNLPPEMSVITERGFNGAWDNACEKTESRWDAPGRPRGS